MIDVDGSHRDVLLVSTCPDSGHFEVHLWLRASIDNLSVVSKDIVLSFVNEEGR